jgi:hypothetical protein
VTGAERADMLQPMPLSLLGRKRAHDFAPLVHAATGLHGALMLSVIWRCPCGAVTPDSYFNHDKAGCNCLLCRTCLR